MQIKKGPYGYYAIEKLDSPDKICAYAEEVIAGNKSDFYLQPVTDYFGTEAMCCFEFSGYLQLTDPEFSVFSPGKKTASHKKDNKNLSLRRRSVGDLFYAFAKLLDNLISPSCLVLDPNMMFTDPEGISVKMCCLPVKSHPDDLCISSLGASRLEELLNCDFFKSIITDDEKNALVYSVKENNEEMFLKIAGLIRGDGGDDPFSMNILKDEKHATTGLPASLRQLSKTEKDLLIAVLSSVLSVLSILGKMPLPCILFFLLSVIIFITTMLNQKKTNAGIRKVESQEQSRQRSSILFSDNPIISQPDEYSSESKNAESVNTYTPLTTGKLTLISDNEKIHSNYSLYLDKTTVGSDCFLSDIVLDEQGIAPLHAVIRQTNGSFYLEPAKGSGKSFIEDSPVENGRSYEIKSGQKIAFGDIEFRFGLNN